MRCHKQRLSEVMKDICPQCNSDLDDSKGCLCGYYRCPQW